MFRHEDLRSDEVREGKRGKQEARSKKQEVRSKTGDQKLEIFDA
jgi:hypothetical protein